MNLPSPARRTILILTGDLGDGHKQAARALAEAAGFVGPNVQTEVVDFMEWTHPHLHGFNRFCYMQWVQKFPSIYGYLFQKTREFNSLSNLFKKIRFFGLSRMLSLLHTVRPSVVVSTFPSAAAAMSVLKTNGWTDVPTVTVITDHTDHSYWIHPGTDRYIVGSGHVRNALRRNGVPDSRITVTGIPVRQPFAREYDRRALCRRYGLDPELPTVLAMGGGDGLIGRDLAELLKGGALPAPMQFIFVCGRNLKLKQLLENELSQSPHRILVTGYVDYIHELMAVSDLLVTKPGGLTTSEALSLELPMVLYKPLPGQEEDNAAYLTEAGLALQADSEEDLTAKLIRVFQNPQILNKIKERARQNQTKTAAVRAVHEILCAAVAPADPAELLQSLYAKA